jgi:hypothetical protein
MEWLFIAIIPGKNVKCRGVPVLQVKKESPAEAWAGRDS